MLYNLGVSSSPECTLNDLRRLLDNCHQVVVQMLLGLVFKVQSKNRDLQNSFVAEDCSQVIGSGSLNECTASLAKAPRFAIQGLTFAICRNRAAVKLRREPFEVERACEVFAPLPMPSKGRSVGVLETEEGEE
jgi:hypothetical protein